MEVERVVPILRIFDLKKAREFYVDYLGFKVDWEHRYEPGMPVYMQVSMGSKLVLHLSEHHGDCCPGSTACVRVKSGLEEYHKEISSKGYGYLRPGIEIEPFNVKSLQLTDPFGNRLRIHQEIEKTADAVAVAEK